MSCTENAFTVPEGWENRVKGVYDCGDGYSMTVCSSRKVSDYYEIKEKYLGIGYETVCENAIGKNRYLSCVLDDKLLHVYYIEAAGELRAVTGRNDIIPSLFDTNNKEGSERPSCTMMPMSYTQASGGGQCIVFRLSDGTFFVMDGGWSGEAYTLYDTLKYLNRADGAGEGPIMISGWFLSHGHVDHTGCIYKFAEVFGKEVIVKALFCNDASVEQMTPNYVSYYMSTKNLTEKVLSFFRDENGNRTRLMKVHTGQKLTFGGAEFEVLFTHEDLLSITVKNFNDLCTVIKATVGGTAFFLTADASKVELPALMSEVEEAHLKCDFCQVGHHGADRGYTPLYPAVGARYYLYPNSYRDYHRDLEINAYEWVKYVVDNAEELYIAEEYSYTFDLPYRSGTAKKTRVI